MNKDEVAEMSRQNQVGTAEKLVPEGYKQTEVGVIPEDWEVVVLDELNPQNFPAVKAGPFGSSLTKNIYVPFGYKIYGQEQVIRGDHSYGDYFIDEDKYRQLRSCEVAEGDILLSLVGTVGKLLVIPGNAAKGIINPRLLRFRFDKSRVLSLFFKYLFESELVQNSLSMTAQGGTMAVLNARMLKELIIPLPDISEQITIANALSDTDALLSELEKLIAKKQAIKTATMQQLLTGRTRLPQFANHPDGSKKGYKQSELGEIPEDWEVKNIGQLCNYQNGTAQEEHFNPYDGYKVVSIGNYSESGRYIDTSNYIGKYLKPIVERFILNKGDLAMILNDKTSIGTIIGRVIHIDADESYVMNQRTMRLTTKGGVSSTYLHFLINSDFTHKRIVGMAKPGTQIYINTDDVLTFQLQFPIGRDEQTAIATILSDMDEEIQALEQRLNKTRQIKQGMMQQLLTGKVRLV